MLGLKMKFMDFRSELGKICPKAKNGANIYFFGCGKRFEDLRNWYCSFANINLEDYVFAFIDNDVNKQGKDFYGKPVLNPNSVTPDNSVILITVVNYSDFSIDRQLMDNGFFWRHDLFREITFFRILKSWIFSQFMELKDVHKNERCFIVGGGASLRASDLDMLVNEKTFAMNKIYKIFDETIWRPDYYITDDLSMTTQALTISENIKGLKFFRFDLCWNEIYRNKTLRFENAYYFSLIGNVHERPAEYKRPMFGEYPDMFFGGGSSTYSCLQLAVFMGFKKIYLLGIDHEYSVMLKNSGEVISNIKQDHFSANYHDESIMEKYKNQGFYILNVDLVTSAFQSAKEYAESHGIKIYNATRGGKLEIFERVDFDGLF